MKLIPERVVIIILTILLVISNVYAVSVGQKQIILTLGNNVAFIDGKPTTLEAAPATIKGKTMVPLRFIGEAFGAKVDWDSATKSATLTMGEAKQECPIHNRAMIYKSGQESTLSNSSLEKSELFYIENGAVKITCAYYPSYERQLVISSVQLKLKKEDGTTVKDYYGIGFDERQEYNKCVKNKDRNCFLFMETIVKNLEKGNYYYEVLALVDSSNDLWVANVAEESK